MLEASDLNHEDAVAAIAPGWAQRKVVEADLNHHGAAGNQQSPRPPRTRGEIALANIGYLEEL